MARFPRPESDIVALAQAMISGFQANEELYPTPPVNLVTLNAKLQHFLQAKDEAIAAEAIARQAIKDKNDRLQALVDDMKSNLRYAENRVKYDDAQLKLIGWGGPKARKEQPLPGQCLSLEALRQGEDWVLLGWEAPTDGGKVLAYKVQERKQGEEGWLDVGTALTPEITLVRRERSVVLEFRVLALNKVGEGKASNTVALVL